MKVKFLKRLKSLISGEPVNNGQLIFLEDEDEDGVYYDMGGRRRNLEGATGERSWMDLEGSHSEIIYNTQTGRGSHAEGCGNIALGEGSHAEGACAPGGSAVNGSTASGKGAHAEGGFTTASGDYSHAEGGSTTASGKGAHAEGNNSTASGDYSHAEGCGTTFYDASHRPINAFNKASGSASHAGGFGSRASGDYSFVHGYGATAEQENQVLFGKFPDGSESVIFAVGHGTSIDNLKNAFEIIEDSDDIIIRIPDGTLISDLFSGNLNGNVTGDVSGNVTSRYQYVTMIPSPAINQKISTHYYTNIGNTAVAYDSFYVRAQDGVIHAKSTSISGVDYAEYFYPWFDNNEDEEDRTGYFVTVRDKKLHKASKEDIIIGVTSETYGVLGTPDAQDIWRNLHETDDLGRIILDEDGNPVVSAEYDPEQNYIPRTRRKEWSAVGILGQIYVRDDGTCEEGAYCTCNEEGIATKATSTDSQKWLVLERVSDNTIIILFK